SASIARLISRRPSGLLPSTLPSGFLRAFILMLIAAHAAPHPARHGLQSALIPKRLRRRRITLEQHVSSRVFRPIAPVTANGICNRPARLILRLAELPLRARRNRGERQETDS